MAMNKVRTLGLLALGLSLLGCADDGAVSLDEASEQDALAQVQPGEFALPARGGSGGTRYVVRGDIIGIDTRSGERIDAINVHMNGQPSQHFGGGGGSENFPLTCGVGQVVQGIRGRNSGRLHQIGLVCAPPDARGNIFYTPVNGSNGGNPFVDICHPSSKVIGFNIRAGKEIDSIQLVCGPL